MSNRDQLSTPPLLENRSLLIWYQATAEQPDFTRGEVQARAIEYLDRLWIELMMSKRRCNYFLDRSLRSPQVPKGLYFYGGVGRGENPLMDALFSCLLYRRKRRVRFHVFMAEIHQWLKILRGEANPLKTVAVKIAKGTRVLCFNEFHVSDVADAMILGCLLENLLSEGVVLVTTLNYAPSKLYPQGQDRSSFLPAIAPIESNLTVSDVDDGKDYQSRILCPAEIFFVLNNEENEQKSVALFKEISGISELNPGINIIRKRKVPHEAQSGHVIWLDFRALCSGPHSQVDYLYLVEHCGMVFLSGLERLILQERAEACRLTWLTDVLYDFCVKLCATSVIGVSDIYIEGDFAEEFTRTVSCMVEMQSEVCLEQPHPTLSK